MGHLGTMLLQSLFANLLCALRLAPELRAFSASQVLYAVWVPSAPAEILRSLHDGRRASLFGSPAVFEERNEEHKMRGSICGSSFFQFICFCFIPARSISLRTI
jgi:hypothetical protein